MQKLIIIKLGGSVITDKDSLIPKAKPLILNRLAKEIGQIYKQDKYKLLLVHGAGSFGHPLVKKFKLHLGVKSEVQKQALGLTYTQLSQLNNLVLSALTKNGVPAVIFPSHSLITQRGGKLNSFNYSPVKTALERGLVPVLSGDMVADETLGHSVISGDVIAPYLAKKLKAELVIFLSDVDGIFDSDPKKNPKAKLIKEVTNSNLSQVLKGMSLNNPHDVTMQMKGKILELRRHLKGIEVLIMNGSNGTILTKALGQYPLGTKLRFD